MRRRSLIAVVFAALVVTVALVWYACTDAYAQDEGYHLIAAWLIAHGRKPYIDFLFPQTPLNAYWNAFLLHFIGESWRVPHTAAALLTAASAALVARYVYRSVSEAWAAPAAISALVLMGLNGAVVEFGSLQAYGLCLFMIVSAWLLTIGAVEERRVIRSFFAGLLSGIAASSSLLTAPIGPVLLIWMAAVNRAGNRIAKAGAFIAGVVAAFVPLLLLWIQSPRQVLFGFLQYQLLYRKVEWDDAVNHNIGELLGWADSGQAVILVLLALAGIALALRNYEWPRNVRQEIKLAAALAVIEAAWLATPRPTFARYFLFTAPFLAIVAAIGLCEIGERLTKLPRPWILTGVVCTVMVYGLAAALFEQRDDFMWSDVAEIAGKVEAVTPPSASLLAEEDVYFYLHRRPPSGMELEDSHKLRFTDADAALQHVVPRPRLDRMIQQGQFATVEMCDTDEIDRLHLEDLFDKQTSAGSCKVFWNFRQPATSPGATP